MFLEIHSKPMTRVAIPKATKIKVNYFEGKPQLLVQNPELKPVLLKAGLTEIAQDKFACDFQVDMNCD